MRPRPDAAENLGDTDHQHGELARFNEAAARCRGKHAKSASGTSEQAALQ